MNENAKKWVEALRSGDYVQGIGRLRTPGNKFCCLGVACDLYIKEHPDTKWHWNDAGGFSDDSGRMSREGTPPFAVANWLGLRVAAGGYSDELGKYRLLTGDNDAGLTFGKIADIIESEPEGLFV